MAAQKGNKYAEKWNEETVLSKLDEIQSLVLETPDEYHLGGFLIKANLYPQWWTEKAMKIKSQEVNESLKRIEGILEGRIVNNTMNGLAKSNSMAIFYLKNKHGYKDVQERKIDSNQKRLVINVVQDDEEE